MVDTSHLSLIQYQLKASQKYLRQIQHKEYLSNHHVAFTQHFYLLGWEVCHYWLLCAQTHHINIQYLEREIREHKLLHCMDATFHKIFKNLFTQF